MQTQKMSLANIKGRLSRVEMKNIMAGSGGSCNLIIKCNDTCWARPNCDNANCTHDETTVYCGGTPYANTYICLQAGC